MPPKRPIVALAAMYPPDEFPDRVFYNYGIRVVEAALRVADPDLEVHVIETEALDVSGLLARVNALNPDLLGLSAYLWSFPSLFEVARRRKRTAPETLIVMGGPAAHVKMFELPPFRDAADVLDAIVPMESGMEAFIALTRLGGRGPKTISSVPGLLTPPRTPATSAPRTRWVETAGVSRKKPLDATASPYQMALMPRGGMAYLRTFEGCPLSCSYCEWGSQKDSRNVFSSAYLTRELEAFAERGAQGALLVDAALNLNSLAFEQLAAAEAQVRFFRDRAFICELYPALMTNAHLKFLEDIQRPTVQVGLQSLDPNVLRGLQRPFDPALFFRVLKDVSKLSSVTVEIILGLPGDNPDSFRRTFDRLRALGVKVRVYHCVVLPSALMTRAPAEFALVFDPISLKIKSALGWPARALSREADRLSDLLLAESGAPAAFWWDFSVPRRAAVQTTP